MFKKLAITGASVALVLGSAVPAFASTNIWNGAEVVNQIITAANTGGNLILSEDDDVNGGLINSGNAGSATLVSNVVNSNDVDSWDCECEGLLIQNLAGVGNLVETVANTGENTIAAYDDVDGGTINSGSANAASVVSNVVNTNVVDDFGWWYDGDYN